MSKTANVSVDARANENIERTLRRFRRACDRAGIRGQARRNRFYEKPSDQRRRQVRKQEQKRRRAERKAQKRQERRLTKLKARARSLEMMNHDPSQLTPVPRRQQPAEPQVRQAG